MKRLGRMQKKGWCARARKRRSNFARDDPGLSHSGEDHSSLAREKNIHGAIKRRVEPRQNIQNGLSFDFQNAPGGIQAHGKLQRRTTVESSFNRLSRTGSCESGSALGPSDSAAAGFSCVSRKIPSTPAATPARASGSINSG